MVHFRRAYGASPLHLLSMVACLAFSAYVVIRLASEVDVPTLVQIGIWFLGAVLLHDLVLFPAYLALDRAGLALARGIPAPVPWINYVRAPALLSGLLLLMFAPLILGLGEEPYFAASGLAKDVFLGRYLLITALLFAGSGLAYAVRLRRAGRTA